MRTGQVNKLCSKDIIIYQNSALNNNRSLPTVWVRHPRSPEVETLNIGKTFHNRSD